MNSTTQPKTETSSKKKSSGCLKAFFIVFGIFIFLMFLGFIFGGGDKDKETETSKIENRVEAKDRKIVLHEDMLEHIDFMRNFKRDGESYLFLLQKIKLSKDLSIKAEVWGNDSTKLLMENELKKEAVKFQKSWFPTIRKEFVEDSKKKMWEHDVEVKCEGSSCSEVTFIGGMFAANRNIKDAHEAIHETLLDMRFKRANYKWVKSVREWDYYTISTKKDDEF